MKYYYIIIFTLLTLLTNTTFSKKIEYKNWLENSNFQSSLYSEVLNLLDYKIPKIKNPDQEKIIIKEINFHLNEISKYQNEFLKLREICQQNYTDFSFNSFLDIEKCIKEKNINLLNQFSKSLHIFSINHNQLFLNANEFKELFINLHSHEVKKENYDIIMKNYYKKIQKINYNLFEHQFLLIIQHFENKYKLNN